MNTLNDGQYQRLIGSLIDRLVPQMTEECAEKSALTLLKKARLDTNGVLTEIDKAKNKRKEVKDGRLD